jgi:hypothetical protein
MWRSILVSPSTIQFSDSLSDPVRESKVKEDVKQALFLAYLFFINSNDKKHSQLKKSVANDHAKGDGEGFPSS